jgi:hypothetical protein
MKIKKPNKTLFTATIHSTDTPTLFALAAYLRGLGLS